MPQQLLNRAEVRTVGQQVRGKRVAETVRMERRITCNARDLTIPCAPRAVSLPPW